MHTQAASRDSKTASVSASLHSASHGASNGLVDVAMGMNVAGGMGSGTASVAGRGAAARVTGRNACICRAGAIRLPLPKLGVKRLRTGERHLIALRARVNDHVGF